MTTTLLGEVDFREVLLLLWVLYSLFVTFFLPRQLRSFLLNMVVAGMVTVFLIYTVGHDKQHHNPLHVAWVEVQ
jgi:hypothetical protein